MTSSRSGSISTQAHSLARTLVMPGPLLDELRAHIDLLDLGGDELLFADAFGGALRRSNFRGRVFVPAVERAGLDGLTFHGLRHSAATQWVANGVDARTVRHRLGHADPRLVLRLYAHASTPADRRAAEVSSTIFRDQDRGPDVPRMCHGGRWTNAAGPVCRALTWGFVGGR